MKEAFEKEFTKDYLDMLDNKKETISISEYVYMGFAHGFKAGREDAIALLQSTPSGTTVERLITLLKVDCNEYT